MRVIASIENPTVIRRILEHLVSGDTVGATAYVAERLAVDRFKGGVLPSDKVEWVRHLQREGHRVGMVGDGANDAAALAVADVGFATGEAMTVTKNVSDITILSFPGNGSFRPWTFRISRRGPWSPISSWPLLITRLPSQPRLLAWSIPS